MRVFNVERNDSCPCGSGRKFKKCCQDRVNEVTENLGRVIGEKEYTATGRDLVGTLGFIFGLRPEKGGHLPGLETVSQALREAWAENEKAIVAQGDDLYAVVDRLRSMLGEKSFLKQIRVPFWQFTHDENEDIDATVMKYLTGKEGDLPTVRAVAAIRLSLLFDQYTAEELKWLLIGLGWLVSGPSGLFWENVVQKTKDDLTQAEEQMNELYDNDSCQEGNNDFFIKATAVFNEYPIYKKLLAASLAEEIKPAVNAITGGELKIDVGLYAVMSGIHATVTGFINSFQQLSAHPGLTPTLQLPLEQGLLPGGDYRFFIADLIASLSRRRQNLSDGELKKAVVQLIVYFSFLFDDSNQLTEYCYLRCICHYLSRLPLTWPEADVEFKEIKDFYNQDLLDKYAVFLTSRKMTEEAEHIQKIGRSLGNQDKDQIELIADNLLHFARGYVGEEQRQPTADQLA